MALLACELLQADQQVSVILVDS